MSPDCHLTGNPYKPRQRYFRQWHIKDYLVDGTESRLKKFKGE